ncbi:MAG: (deoxy)nucleoside triphosphate pyrophosphohydrolase [Calditrichaeota bacterium]|nr:(deoxy)nucleoside triphosphate pyrophosphohydrolase [Calditrichota bacterium]
MEKQETIVPVLAGIIENADGRILLTRRKPHLSNAGKWEFPGGKLRPGEQPPACLQRELREELGIDVRVNDPFEIVNFTYDRGHILLIAYRCQYRGGTIRMVDHDRYEWVRPEDLLKYDLSAADIPIAQKLVAIHTGR